VRPGTSPDHTWLESRIQWAVIWASGPGSATAKSGAVAVDLGITSK
jgi:hypothetical protein